MTGELRLVREAPVADLLPAGGPRRLEASGVVAVYGRYHVIFDNLRAVIPGSRAEGTRSGHRAARRSGITDCSRLHF